MEDSYLPQNMENLVISQDYVGNDGETEVKDEEIFLLKNNILHSKDLLQSSS